MNQDDNKSGSIDWLKYIEQMQAAREKEMKESFSQGVKEIDQIFKKYSVQDVATSLFVSSLWLPNIASPIKHQLLTAVFASTPPEDFSETSKINTHDDFKLFLQEVYMHLPSFVTLEDFVPEPDWGTIKFYHNEKNYKIFYGNELSNVYDWLMLFQIIYGPFDKEYREHTSRSPNEELAYCLQLQDKIITELNMQAKQNDLTSVIPGYVEVPSLEFWKQASAFYLSFQPQQTVEKAFLDNFSIQAGSLPKSTLTWEAFGDLVFDGRLLQAFFIQLDNKYFPILPRRFTAVLFDGWARVYGSCHEKIADNKSYALRIGGEIHKYIKSRIRNSNIIPVVSAFNSTGPHETIFSTTFISGNRLILIYIPSPVYSKDETENELNSVIPKIKEALRFIQKSPLRMFHHLDRMVVEYRSHDESRTLTPYLYIVFPQVSTHSMSLRFDKNIPGESIFLDQFLGLIDELDDAEMLASFLDYLEEYSDRIRSPLLSVLDKLGSFKSFFGVLEEGALRFDNIALDPHWGSNMRYSSLSEFWKLYPEVHYFDHPRSWKLEQETKTRLRMIARGYIGSALYCKIALTHTFITAPFKEMSFEQAKISNLLMECLEDSISAENLLIGKHPFFERYQQLNILFFPLSLVLKDDRFKHLIHLLPSDNYWRLDYGLLKDDIYGLRIVFDDASLFKAFIEATDRAIEVELLLEVLAQVNEIVSYDDLSMIIEALEKTKVARPRFKIQEIEKPAAFPEFIATNEPTPIHFKMARKRIAELARKIGLSEGYYEFDEAKFKLNDLRRLIVQELNQEVSKYNIKTTIPYLITRIDALNDRYERTRLTIAHSVEQDVDYDRDERLADKHTKYIQMHKNCRYLIEKFVQIQPSGTSAFEDAHFQYLIALVDWLHSFYDTSDSLHYGIHSAGITITDQFIVEVVVEKDLAEKQNEFGKEEKAIELGLIGKYDDRIDTSKKVDVFFEKLNKAFLNELGFTFVNMVGVLKILTYWPGHKANIPVSSFYCSDETEIADVCKSIMDDISHDEIVKIIDFLTLKSRDVICVLGQEEPCDDLPVWEHKKRYARYTLRPLIKIDDKYYWGPYSTMKAGITWTGPLPSGRLPIVLGNSEIQNVIEDRKRTIERELESKSFEITKRYTPYACSNVDLYKIDKAGGYPADLGDYDVLAFLSKKNVILNIECKDITPASCLKDAKTLREKIFGEQGKKDGHFRQINRRQKYLMENLKNIATTLSWPVDLTKPPKIIPLYVSRISYWWTKYPPVEVDSIFLRIDLLSNYIENL